MKENIIYLNDAELIFIQRAVTLLDDKYRESKKGYNSSDKEFVRKLIIKLLSTKETD